MLVSQTVMHCVVQCININLTNFQLCGFPNTPAFLRSAGHPMEGEFNKADLGWLCRVNHEDLEDLGLKGYTRVLLPDSKSHNPPGVLRCSVFGQLGEQPDTKKRLPGQTENPHYSKPPQICKELLVTGMV